MSRSRRRNRRSPSPCRSPCVEPPRVDPGDPEPPTQPEVELSRSSPRAARRTRAARRARRTAARAEPERPGRAPAELSRPPRCAERRSRLRPLEVESRRPGGGAPASEPMAVESDGELTIAEIEAAGPRTRARAAGRGRGPQIVPGAAEDEAPAESWITGESARRPVRPALGAPGGSRGVPRRSSDSGPGLVETVSLRARTGPEEEAPPTGVISTDAFLSDFDDRRVGRSREGWATSSRRSPGAAAHGRASSRRRPRRAEHTALRRDDMVDKDLVMKVIEGIKNL